MRRALVVPVVEILRRPGTRRDVTVELEAEEIGLDDDRLVPGARIRVALVLESLNDTVIVEGDIGCTWRGTCRRCLNDVGGDLETHLAERYEERPKDLDSFPIEGDHLDLAPVVREAVLLDLPVGPLCIPDCRGLCPDCGVDRNVDECACVTEATDDRWSALDALREQLDD